jgi:O-Antigen ligase
MIRKKTIAYLIFFATICYIITPWFFERTFFINELLAGTGLLLLTYKRFKVGNDLISICMVLLLAWSGIHLFTSLLRQDSMYYYLRNSVIVYSMFTFFIGFYLLKYLSGFIAWIRNILRYYIGIFLFIPLPLSFFERYGVSTLFPSLFKNARYRLLPLFLIVMNIIYALTYASATALMIATFLFLVFISTGYKFFRQTITIGIIAMAILFIYLQPNLALIKNQFSPRTTKAIHEVMHSNPLLAVDGNTTWRLVIWNQILVDRFPANIFGLGFGTPVLKYYPIEDYKKLSTLPYVMGGHNSFIYLFGRLGIIYLIIIISVYIKIFKEYFYHKQYYYTTSQIFVFWSFFIITVMALFNPILESPLFASAYWMLLGFTARCIYNRKLIDTKLPALV